MNALQSGLIDDDAVISAELKTLVETLGKLDEVIEADRAALTVVERAEHVLDIHVERHVVMVSGLAGVVVDREWAELS